MNNFPKILFLLLMSLMAQVAQTQSSGNGINENKDQVQLRNATKINTPHLEFSPAYYQNGIVFASSRFEAGKLDEKINETFFELFYSETDANNEPLKPRAFSMAVNSFLHEGPVTFNRAGNRIFFTRNNIQKGLQKADSKGVVRLKIYEAKKGVYDWEEVKELQFNSDEFSCAHPTLSADETKLYFSSDRPGGFGGMDIWVVEKSGSLWGNPVNLGPDFNTSKNEVFPFFHSSGNLFFSSNGHSGKGGLDIFMTNIQNESNIITNLGAPFNSDEDDLGLILSPDGTTGYFSSARSGGTGKDDIYFFEAPNGISGVTRPGLFAALITVFDADDNAPVEGAALRVFEKNNSFASGGYGRDDDALYEAVLMTAKNDSNELVFKLIRKDPSALGAPDKITDGKGEIKYEFSGEKEYLLLVTKDGYTTKELTFKTTGNIAASEIKISLEKQKCISLKGVVQNKINGEFIPGAIVKLWNECTGEEVQVFAGEKGNYEFCIEPGCNYLIKGIKENYSGEFAKITAEELATISISRNIFLTPNNWNPSVTSGTVIVLENIFYDFDKSYIRAGAARELDELAAMMQRYPTMIIELIAHTDSRGEDAYNYILSQKRAESAREYLISKGINPERILGKGYGETQPRNHCIDGVRCKERDYQINRRTEVRVISIVSPINIRYGNNVPEVIDRE